MNSIDKCVNGRMESAMPLFASSWVALFVLLRQELDALREEREAQDTASKPAPERAQLN